MAREEARGKRPLKLWDCWRNVRKGLVVGSYEELILRGKDKLGVAANEPVRLVLECDGTQVEDGDYFRTLANNSVLLLLRQGERWFPSGADVIKAAISAIPKIVCETIHALELQDETPSWKIMDNKGRVTVVLHWDQRHGQGLGGGTSTQQSSSSATSAGVTLPPPPSGVGGGGGKFSPSKKQPMPRYPVGPQITVINHDDALQARMAGGSRRLSGSRGSSFDGAAVHVHTPECIQRPQRTSPAPEGLNNGPIECDFHCCALHEEGRKIAVHKSVATSPIQDAQQQTSPQPPSSLSDGTRRSGLAKGHVRFLDIEGSRSATDRDSSESETENTMMEDEAVTSEKFLLLIDQLSVDQKRHLSIKDIGIILERLSSKILDVERLDRESESDDCYNWTIKATIRGDVLRELGVIYNGNYYAISEHPGYKEESEENPEECEEEEEEEDRL